MTALRLECEDCPYGLDIADIGEMESLCPDCGGVLILVAEEEEPESSGASAGAGPLADEGPGPDLPPLPQWDGSDTQEVAPRADSGALGELGELVHTVHVGSSGTRGRGSRTYDSEELSGRLSEEPRAWEDPNASDEATRDWEVEGPSQSPGTATLNWKALREVSAEAKGQDADIDDDTGGWQNRLFPVDHDWEALIEESLPELEEDDPSAERRVIRLPESAAPRAGEELDAEALDSLLRPFGFQAPSGTFGPEDPDPQAPPTRQLRVTGAATEAIGPAPPGPDTEVLRPSGSGAMRTQSGPVEPQRTVDSVRFEDLDPALVVERRGESATARDCVQLAHRLMAPGPTTVLVSSAARREGRTALALNLALAGARHPTRGAVYVEADLDGRGALSVLGQPSCDEGLLNLVQEKNPDPRRALVRFQLGRFDLLPRGHGLGREKLVEGLPRVLRALREHFPDALIVVDGPPVAEGGADLLAATDSALLVIRRRWAPRDLVQNAVASLGRSALLGAVFNEA